MNVDALVACDDANGASQTSTVHLDIGGEPLAQPRHRVRRLSNHRVVFYDPAAAAKSRLRRMIRLALEEIGVSTFPFFNRQKLSVNVTFVVSDTRKDIDNLLKYILDAMNQVVYNDDRTVCVVNMKKIVADASNNPKSILEMKTT